MESFFFLGRFLWNAYWRASAFISRIRMIWRCTSRGKPFSSRPLSVYISELVTGLYRQRRSRGLVRLQTNAVSRAQLQYHPPGWIVPLTMRRKLLQPRSRPLSGVTSSENWHELMWKVSTQADRVVSTVNVSSSLFTFVTAKKIDSLLNWHSLTRNHIRQAVSMRKA